MTHDTDGPLDRSPSPQHGDVVWLWNHDGSRTVGVWVEDPNGLTGLHLDGAYVVDLDLVPRWEIHRGEVIDQGDQLMLIDPDTVVEVDQDGQEYIDADRYPPTWIPAPVLVTDLEKAQARLDLALGDLGTAQNELQMAAVYGPNAPVDPALARAQYRQAITDRDQALADLAALSGQATSPQAADLHLPDPHAQAPTLTEPAPATASDLTHELDHDAADELAADHAFGLDDAADLTDDLGL